MVILLSSHIPLKDVFSYITKERCYHKFKLATEFNQKYLKGEIAVCGLNPHAVKTVS